MTTYSIENSLELICKELINDLKIKYHNEAGACYLTGHVLDRSFKSLGYNSKEVTGILHLKDTNGKWVIYGPDHYKKFGKLVGYYHTWCCVNINEVEYIIDPTPITMKSFLKKIFKVKLSKNLPDYVVSSNLKGLSYIYEEDESLVPKSKEFLIRIPEADIIQLVINTTYRLKTHFQPQ